MTDTIRYVTWDGHKGLIRVGQADLADLLMRITKLELLLKHAEIVVDDDPGCIPSNADQLADIGRTGMCHWDNFVAQVRRLVLETYNRLH